MAEIMYVDWDGLVYYDTRSKQYIKDIVDQTIKFGGHYTFEDVPAPGFETLHVAYKITDKFVVSPETAYFLKTCAGKTFEAGTVILVVEDGESDTYRFDILFEAYSGTPLTPDGELDLSNYYTRAQVDNLLSGKVNAAELDRYYLKTETDNLLADKANKSDLNGLATEEFVATSIKAIKIPDEYVTEEELLAKEFATKDDLAAYATDEDLNTVSLNVEELGKNVTKNTADIETLDDAVANNTGAVEALRGEVTEVSEKVTDLQEAVNNISIPNNYVTDEELEAKGYITEHQDISHLATKDDIPDVSNFATKDEIPSIEGLATEQFVTDKISEIDIPEVPTKVSELENDAEYTTESWVVNKIDSWAGALETQVMQHYASKDELADLNTNVTNQMAAKADVIHVHKVDDITDLDLSSYYDKTETETLVNEAINGITIPDTSNFITMQDVEDKGYLTEHQDISGKADVDHKHTLADIDDYVPVDLEPYALKTDIPSIEGLATETFVKNAIAEAELGDKEVDLTGYATKDELSAVEAKIPSIEGLATETFVTDSINNIQPTDLSNYYNKTETENLVDDAVKAIIVPEVPTNISAFTNDANYTTLVEVATQGYLTSIPDEYVTSEELAQEGFLKEHQSLEGYVKDAELTDAIEAVEHKIVTKTSELENDAEFVTASTLPAFVKPDDITDFVTLTEVEEAGFIKSIPNEYVTETELTNRQFVTEESLSQKGFITDVSDKADKDHTHSYNDLTDLPTIPSIEGLATKDYVNEAVANIDAPAVDTTNLLTKDEANTLLAAKANDVPFADDYRVGTDLGGFVADESLQGMTVVQILTKLLGLTKYVAPEVPEGSSAVVEEIITNQATIYSQDENGNLVETEFVNTTWTEAEAAPQMNGVSTFYQIVNDEGTVIESGYQEATTYNEEAWLTIALPDSIESFTVKQYDGLRNGWYEVNFVFEKAAEQTMDGYIIWTVPEKYEVMSGSTYRFVIE